MRRILLFAVVALFMLGVSGAPASAETGSTEQTATITRELAVSAKGAGTQAVCPLYRYGYYGEAMCGTWILDVHWNSDGSRPETFVIAPNRTIWHAWPGSGRWHEMPGAGRADDTDIAFWVGGDRVVSVWVSNSGYWCNTDPAGAAGWTGWWFCG